MSGSSPAALGGEVTLEIEGLSERALEPVDLGTKEDRDSARGARGKDTDDDEGDKGDRDDDHRGTRESEDGGDDDEGYSPDAARRRVQAARRGERRAMRRADRLENQMVRVSAEVEGLKGIASGAMENGAKQRMSDAQRAYNEAFARRTAAFDEGKSADWNKAEVELKAAERDFAAAQASLREIENNKAAQATSVSTTLRDGWMDENEWFDPNGADKHSKLAIEISKQVAADKIPPNTQAHFDEMDRRLRKQAPELFNKRQRDDEQDDDQERDEGDKSARGQERQHRQERDRGPRGAMGSDRDRGHNAQTDWSKNTKVPQALVDNYRAAGFDVDDPKVKARIIGKYNESASRMYGGMINVG